MEGNVVFGGGGAFSWVNIDGGIVHPTGAGPAPWVCASSTTNEGSAIVVIKNGQFHANEFVFATGGVCLATTVAGRAVRSYRTLSPLPAANRRRFAFCGTFPGVAPGGR